MPATPYAALCTFVQHLAPTWCATQHRNFARLLAALIERPALCLSELARAWPRPDQPLHGRLKRLGRFLDNPRLDELALSARWLRLSQHLGSIPPNDAPDRPLLPLLLDTTYFGHFAALIGSVPCGSRALPIVHTTYHRSALRACFPPRTTWANHAAGACPARCRRGQQTAPAAATVRAFLSQNQIEGELIDLLWQLASPRLRPVLVADRGFARASLFQSLREQGRAFVIRIDSQTHLRLAPNGPSAPVNLAVPLAPGERRWLEGVCYQQEEQVPVNLLAVWESGQAEPWYLATILERCDWTETLYRWRMRIECANRDEKTGVILREGGDQHGLHNVLHLHRLLLAVGAAHWFCALSGLQALHDLPAVEDDPSASAPLEAAPPMAAPVAPLLRQGPARPPPVCPHRGPPPAIPPYLRRFTARGPLSYVRLGLEVLRAPDLGRILLRLAHWLGIYLWPHAPPWRPYQIRYRLRHWWAEP
jgi:hypothetical protein